MDQIQRSGSRRNVLDLRESGVSEQAVLHEHGFAVPVGDNREDGSAHILRRNGPCQIVDVIGTLAPTRKPAVIARLRSQKEDLEAVAAKGGGDLQQHILGAPWTQMRCDQRYPVTPRRGLWEVD